MSYYKAIEDYLEEQRNNINIEGFFTMNVIKQFLFQSYFESIFLPIIGFLLSFLASPQHKEQRLRENLRLKIIAKFILRFYLELNFMIQYTIDELLSNENLPLFIQGVIYSNIFMDNLNLLKSYGI